MGKLYDSYAEAVAQDTECQFDIGFTFELPSVPFPPSIPIPDFIIELVEPPFFCPLD